MEIDFDPLKNTRNIELHGISFERVGEFDWSRAVVLRDMRKEYGEPRYRAFGPIGGRLYALVFTPRVDRLRIISLRKANPREVRRYEQTKRESF